MENLAHHARMHVRDKDGTLARDHVEAMARRGDAKAIAMLEEPEVPDEIAHLREYLFELHGRSGIGFNGINPLTYNTVMDWMRLTGIELSPAEVRVLLDGDWILCNPPREPFVQ